MTRATSFFLAVVALLAASATHAQTTVTDPWVRGTVPTQKSSGLFLQITSQKGGRLVGASTPVAGAAEVHEMSMEGSVMKMRALPDGLALPAGKPVALSPGGRHVMLFDLKQQLKAGDHVPVTLIVQDADGKREEIKADAVVKDPASGK